jgi:hypothetical protein
MAEMTSPGSDDPTLSALVILRSGAGREVTGQDRITVETVAEFQPEPGELAATQRFFRSAGFDLGEPVGISFSISGPRSLFETAFGERLSAKRERGVVRSVRTAGGGLELPLRRLPAGVSQAVQAVAFPPPPEFGSVDP